MNVEDSLSIFDDEVKRKCRFLHRTSGVERLKVLTTVAAYCENSGDGKALIEQAIHMLQKYRCNKRHPKHMARCAKAHAKFMDSWARHVGFGAGIVGPYAAVAWVYVQREREANEQRTKSSSDAVLRTTDADNDVPQQGVTP